jgi:hypothetical protein
MKTAVEAQAVVTGDDGFNIRSQLNKNHCRRQSIFALQEIQVSFLFVLLWVEERGGEKSGEWVMLASG